MKDLFLKVSVTNRYLTFDRFVVPVLSYIGSRK